MLNVLIGFASESEVLSVTQYHPPTWFLTLYCSEEGVACPFRLPVRVIASHSGPLVFQRLDLPP